MSNNPAASPTPAKKSTKTAAVKTPPSPWYLAILGKPVEGLPAHCRVYVRRAREGGWRVLSQTKQFRLNDSGMDNYVVFLRDDAGGFVPAKPKQQERLNEHLQAIFKGTTPKAYQPGGEKVQAA